MSRIDELLEEHNRLASIALDKWDGDEAGLEKRVKRLRAKAPANRAGKPAETEKRQTIGGLVRAELNAGNVDVESILTKVRKAFPQANTNANSVRWYASQEGVSLRGGAKPAAKKGAAKKGAAKKGAAKKGAAKKGGKSAKKG